MDCLNPTARIGVHYHPARQLDGGCGLGFRCQLRADAQAPLGEHRNVDTTVWQPHQTGCVDRRGGVQMLTVRAMGTRRCNGNRWEHPRDARDDTQAENMEHAGCLGFLRR